MTDRQKTFWNNWDFKTILVLVQLIGVIWLVATTYEKLEAKVELNKQLLNHQVADIRDDIGQMRIQLEEIHKIILNGNKQKSR